MRSGPTRLRLAVAAVTVVLISALTSAVAPAMASGATFASTSPSRVLGFYADWDPASYRTLRAHYRDITVLSPGWLELTADGRLVHDDFAAEAKVNSFIARTHPAFALEPLVANWDPTADDWDAGTLAGILGDSARRDALATSITVEAQSNGWRGVNIDFEELPETSRDDLTAFMRSLYSQTHPLGLELSEDVNVDDPVFDCSSLATCTDFLVPMLYDEHWDTSNPGPIASQNWFAHTLRTARSEIPASRIVVGIGNYGYHWRGGRSPADSISTTDAFALARRANRTIRLSPGSLNPTFRYGSHRVWFLDAVTAFNEISIARRYGVSGYGLWKLGGEDPGLWRVLHRRDSLTSAVARALRTSRRTITYSLKRKLIVGELVRP